MELQLDVMPAGGVIDGCLRMVSCDAAQKGVAIESASLDALPAIKGDPTRLRQIFLNLLTNAVKYSSERGRVRVSGAVEGRFVALRIEDEGTGMRSADIAAAVRPFERIRNAETANQDGVGLGLAIVKTLVDAHGGELAIESETGRGTIVTVRLPAASESATVQQPLPAAAVETRRLKLSAAR